MKNIKVTKQDRYEYQYSKRIKFEYRPDTFGYNRSFFVNGQYMDCNLRDKESKSLKLAAGQFIKYVMDSENLLYIGNYQSSREYYALLVSNYVRSKSKKSKGKVLSFKAV